MREHGFIQKTIQIYQKSKKSKNSIFWTESGGYAYKYIKVRKKQIMQIFSRRTVENHRIYNGLACGKCRRGNSMDV